MGDERRTNEVQPEWAVLINEDGEPYAVDDGTRRRSVDTSGNVEPRRRSDGAPHAWKGKAEDGSVGFDLRHEGRSLGAVTFAADGDVEIVLRGAKPGVAQKVRGRSDESTSETAPAAVQAAVEHRSCKPVVPGSSPGPGLRSDEDPRRESGSTEPGALDWAPAMFKELAALRKVAEAADVLLEADTTTVLECGADLRIAVDEWRAMAKDPP